MHLVGSRGFWCFFKSLFLTHGACQSSLWVPFQSASKILVINRFYLPLNRKVNLSSISYLRIQGEVLFISFGDINRTHRSKLLSSVSSKFAERDFRAIRSKYTTFGVRLFARTCISMVWVFFSDVKRVHSSNGQRSVSENRAERTTTRNVSQCSWWKRRRNPMDPCRD